jgi:hypothetical protein
MSTRVRIDDRDDPDERQEWLEGRRGRDRLELAREAGWGQMSWLSVFAGVVTAIGTFAFCAGVAAAVLHPLGIKLDDLTDSDWKRVGLIAGIAAAAALLIAFAFGGYVAGRMARRAGLRHGVLVFVLGLVVLAAATGIAQFEDALSAIRDRLESLGAPTGGSVWGGVGVLTLVVALAGMLLGSLFGAARGERWHQRLVARAVDPDVGPEARLRADVEAQRQAAAAALAKAREAGVLTGADEPTAAKTEAVSWEPGRSDEEEMWGDREATAAGRSMPPSSRS